MSKFIDITGNRYNNLIVVKRVENAPGGVTVWECICDCGNTTFVRGVNLKSGAVKSCGCLLKNMKTTLRHNMSNSRLYHVWASIKRRCNAPSDKNYKNYGSRGIKMYKEWADSFETFMAWALNNGYSDSLTIERIDVNGDYCPENCTWIPANEQQKNRRTCYSITYNGRTQNLVDWCNELNLPYKLIHNRIHKLGWTFVRSITEPVHAEKRNSKNG